MVTIRYKKPEDKEWIYITVEKKEASRIKSELKDMGYQVEG